MKSVKWRTVLRSAFSLASVSVLLFGAMTAAASEVVIAPPDKGTLILKTGAHGKLEFRWEDRADEEDDIVQKIIDKSWTTRRLSDVCVLKLLESTPEPGGLVALSATGGVPGVAFDHIGVKGSGWCSEINGYESLTLSLSGLLAEYQVYHTELNLEMDPHAVVKIVTRFGDSEQTSIIRSPGTAYPGSEPCAFETATHERDICRWKSDAIWTSATVKVLRGSASIEAGSGGGDGEFSKFSLTKFNATLPCAPENPAELPIGVTVVDDPENPQATATVTRLKNSVPGEQCQPLQVAFEWDGPNLQFFSADQGQSVASTFTITWPIEDVPNVGDTVLDAIPLSKQTFQQLPDESGQPVFIEYDIDLCRGTPTGYVQDPDPTHPGEFLITGLVPDAGVADQSDLPGFQYGCAYEQRVTFPEANKIFVKQWIYLSGDWAASRTR
jgi:hypothetical protein